MTEPFRRDLIIVLLTVLVVCLLFALSQVGSRCSAEAPPAAWMGTPETAEAVGDHGR